MASNMEKLAKRRAFKLAKRPEVSVGQKGKTPHGRMTVPLAESEYQHRRAHPAPGNTEFERKPYKGKAKRQGYVKTKY